eukprot:CAMPEP_0115152138 /NCGR_PEP_ID=MMETSP0227-20121206/65997_1 /TAXON_ID=89957 /ORGANISM="Polarella glacialis, Strain CCMP 1383" /LENGTH=647 /DNA_ID=CAMNT_0002562719 /DNA_START=210 /DNA_END=2155 /DNA_ORIENTATION=+
MMLPVLLRPVTKSASRLFVAGTGAAADRSTDSSQEVNQPPATTYNHHPLQSQPPATPERKPSAAASGVPPLWNTGSASNRWVQNVLAQGGRQDGQQEQQVEQHVEQLQGAGEQQVQMMQQQMQYGVSGADASASSSQCVWQPISMGSFPAGAWVWPAVFLTNDGYFSQGMQMGGYSQAVNMNQGEQHQQMQMQQPQQLAQEQSQAQHMPVDCSQWEGSPAVADFGASGGSPRTAAGRTAASRKQRRKQKTAVAVTGAASAAPQLGAVVHAVVEPQPAQPGLLAPRGAQSGAPIVGSGPSSCDALIPGPVVFTSAQSSPKSSVQDLGSLLASTEAGSVQYWPPTPESTPPSSPRHAQASLERFGNWPMQPAAMAARRGQIETHMVEEDAAVPNVEAPPNDEEMERCEVMLAQLEDADGRPELMELLATHAWDMACTAGGTRVVQKALEVASAAERVMLTEQMQGHVREAFASSPHANHVLQKCIELISPDRVQFVLAEMRGNAVAAARHRYGCRVLERLLEHCPTEQTAPLVDEVLGGAPQLCRHTFGNFVVQHVLEHGTPEQRHLIADVIQADIQAWLDTAWLAPEDRQRMVQAIRADASEQQTLHIITAAASSCAKCAARKASADDGKADACSFACLTQLTASAGE